MAADLPVIAGGPRVDRRLRLDRAHIQVQARESGV